jgi:hypothetical protein
MKAMRRMMRFSLEVLVLSRRKKRPFCSAFKTC